MPENMKTYVRQTLKERGHFSNYFTFLPVNKLSFGDDILIVQLGKKNYQFSYEELKAEIQTGYTHKAYGSGTGARIKQTLVHIFAPDSTFTFDLSGQFPDFKKRKEIHSLVLERIKTKKVVKNTLKEHITFENYITKVSEFNLASNKVVQHRFIKPQA